MANQVAVDVEQAWPYIQKRLERYLAGASLGSGGSAGGATVGEHDLDGPLHSGSLARSQAPWVATDIASAVASHVAAVDPHPQYVLDTGDRMTGSLTISAATQLVFQVSATDRASIAAGGNTFDINPLPDATATGEIRLFRLTNTTGTKGLRLFAGDNSTTTTHYLGVNGTTIFNAALADLDFNVRGDTDSSLFYVDASTDRVGIGRNDPAYKFDVNGTVRATGVFYAGSDIEVTGDLLAANGSAGAPAIAFLSDTDTGVYRSGTNAFSLVAGGTAIVNVGATGVGVNAAFDSTAAFKVQSKADDDTTLLIKQKSGQTARMWRVENAAGQELIVLDSAGNLQSGNPGFASGVRGWQVSSIGNAEFNNITARGELHASIFVMDEFHASGGTLYIAPAGKLENAATVYTTTGVQEVLDVRTTSGTFSGTQVTVRTTSGTFSGTTVTRRYIKNYFDITDPPSGHAMILSAGDIIRCKALGESVGIDLFDVWGVVTRVEDMTTYYRYYYERKSGGADGLVLPAGTAIISYGKPGDGRIYLTADQNYAPYWQVFITGNEPWNGDIIPTVRGGRLDGVGLPGVSGIPQYGIVMSRDLSDASAPYMVMSNLQQFMYNIDSEWNNGNPTARITAGGAMLLGTDIDNAATTGFEFNPTTGAVTIGSAAYPGTVTVYGTITVTGGSGYANFSDKPTTLSGINATEGSKLAGIAPGATVGATWGTNLNSIPTRFGDAPGAAGLYLTPTHLGYYNGSAWKAWIAASGEFYFGGSSGAHLEWNGSKLRGIGTDGTTEQWYANAADGKLYAAAGGVGMDSTGIWLRMNASSSWATASAITFRSTANWNTIDAVLSTRTVTSSRYLNLFIDPDTTPVGLEIIASPAAQRVNITHNLTVQGDLTMSGDIDMDAGSIVNIGSAGVVSTWTPGITFGGGSTGLTYSSRTGRYVKIGKLVYASCEIRLSNKGSSTGSAKITGLPVTSATTSAGGVPSILWYQMSSNFVHVSGAVETGATAIVLVGYTAAAASYALVTNSDFANNSILQVTVVYEAA